jgi:para-aminobenzoate synthetase component 1
MFVQEPEYACYTPLPDGNLTFYTLFEPQLTYCTGVVHIPYSETPEAPAQPLFYKIKKTEVFYMQHAAWHCKPSQLTAEMSKAAYIKALQHLKTHIQRGDIYEINFCQKFIAQTVITHPLHLFFDLCNAFKMPYAFLLKHRNTYLFCLSPELFLKKSGTTLISKPIKGTAPRHANARMDADAKQQLQVSEKERAEHVMAVDVARHDLAQIAQRDSVTVPVLFGIESFSNVHQLVSTVQCQLASTATWREIISACFPMASMTGAPKQKAIELISRYETFKRNWYSGALGLITEAHDFELAVVIRSMFYNHTTHILELCAGGAITQYSDPQQEYEECILKLRRLVQHLGLTW